MKSACFIHILFGKLYGVATPPATQTHTHMANTSPENLPSRRPTTRAGRRARQRPKLPNEFVPGFLELADKRCKVVRLIREQIEKLKEDAGVDCIQKELLAKQAVFISIQLETMQVETLEGKEFDAGRFCNLSNTLVGLLKALGLDRSATKVQDLKTYLGGTG